ncbi:MULTISPECIES: MerR family transcriptional regulator [Nocardiopsis]|jgi:DNA-binding transcriptional MerR regulator|uniref:MerR family transcriptional regulator n=1 Tax=Nocardiopsis alba TaxID=53437 RepID=A0A7K2IR36_9ACTN|nr:MULTISPECIES: MerR family transcriptional regulator [Nocardiopsis]MEC3892732.1 MerR family transcriptional regulator [Nocardiopsis sp. LDBS1602]MYR32346.1 MerR family transcriptional regulator [Nocardiopsis alba]
MRIGELAERTGASPRSLRYYEQRGLLASERSANGYREYGADAVERVRNIRLLLESGLTSEDVQELQACLELDLVREPACAEAVALYEQRLQAVRERIDTLTATERRLEERIAEL